VWLWLTHLDCTSTVCAVASLRGVQVGFLIMNTSLITRYRETFYRETASGTYKGALFPIAHFLIEIPWLVGLSLLVRAVCPFTGYRHNNSRRGANAYVSTKHVPDRAVPSSPLDHFVSMMFSHSSCALP
jgi:hypothetical protein